MADDMFIHFNSNSSNQSDQSEKLAKLRARMERKESGSTAVSARQPIQFSATSERSDGASHNHAFEEGNPKISYWLEVSVAVAFGFGFLQPDNVEEFLIQANTLKRQKIQDDDGSVVEHIGFLTRFLPMLYLVALVHDLFRLYKLGCS
ncbi:hypothetical protein Dimus_020105 [Dionaea muscipula]